MSTQVVELQGQMAEGRLEAQRAQDLAHKKHEDETVGLPLSLEIRSPFASTSTRLKANKRHEREACGPALGCLCAWVSPGRAHRPPPSKSREPTTGLRSLAFIPLI
jgi:hypothetical protein